MRPHILRLRCVIRSDSKHSSRIKSDPRRPVGVDGSGIESRWTVFIDSHPAGAPDACPPLESGGSHVTRGRRRKDDDQGLGLMLCARGGEAGGSLRRPREHGKQNVRRPRDLWMHNIGAEPAAGDRRRSSRRGRSASGFRRARLGHAARLCSA